jgi:hypothetical protein
MSSPFHFDILSIGLKNTVSRGWESANDKSDKPSPAQVSAQILMFVLWEGIGYLPCDFEVVSVPEDGFVHSVEEELLFT